MSRIYFEGWYYGAYVKAEDWYTDNLVYVNVRIYERNTAFDRPDVEKSFLLSVDDPERIAHYDHTIADFLIRHKEVRDPEHRLLPIKITLPVVDLGCLYEHKEAQ